jgi:alpha-aminoadipic semialdehyde synthase
MVPKPGTLGIVRECYSKWERRAPLTPSHVERLIKAGSRVLVQPSNQRVFADSEYAAAGATITENLDEAAAIFGVKQQPAESLLPNRAYTFFSHVIKAQPENMALLDAIREKKIRLFDYEVITQGGLPGSARTVAFGEFAGRAGMIGGLRSLGERALNLGYHSPLLSIGSAYMYPTLAAGKDAVSAVGDGIKRSGMPEPLSPFAVVFTGNGAASRGAREIFDLLPHTMVSPEELPHLPVDRHQLYGCVVEEEHMAARKDGGAFTRASYYAKPSDHESVFAQNVVPYSSAIINCAYWDQRYQRLLTTKQLTQLKESGNNKLLGVVDVSCDIEGAFEMLTHSTYPESPHYLFDTQTGSSRLDLSGDGLLMCGVDILPSELPREASAHFGDALLANDVAAMGRLDYEQGWDDAKAILSPELAEACIAADGALVQRFQYIDQMRASREDARSAITAATAGSTVVELNGHLFDSGMLNVTLDLLEKAVSTAPVPLQRVCVDC